MKQFYLLLLVALSALGSAKAATPFDCTISVVDLQAYQVTLQFTPVDGTRYYICGVSQKSTYDNMGEDYIMSYYHNTMDASIAEGSATSYTDFAHVGAFEYSNYKLNAQTEYVAFAYGINALTGQATTGMQTLSFSTPAESVTSESIDLHIVSPHWYDKVSTSGYWQLTGWTTDYDYYVQFCADPATCTTGTFTLTDTSWDWDYTGVYFYPGPGSSPIKRNCTAMTVTISIEDEILNAQAEYTDDRGVVYHITFDALDLRPSAEGNSYDMDQDVVASFSTAEGHQKYDLSEGCHTVWYQNADREYFEAKLYTPGLKIADGTYEICESSENFTCEPCSSNGTNIYGSVYGVLTADGYMSSPWFWFMGGTIVVSHDAKGALQLEVHATNSWGKTALITVNKTTGISAVGVDSELLAPRKYLQQGKVVISKGDRLYNLLGVELK